MVQPQDLALADFAAITPAIISAACARAMEECDAAVDAIVGTPADERTFANTLLALEEATEHVAHASGVYAFMGYVSDDADVRDAAHEWDEALEKYGIGLEFREDLYAAVREFAETPSARVLTGEDARLLERKLRDYRRNGFELPAEERAHVRAMFDELASLDVQFRKAIDEWDDGIEARREELAGLPDAFIDSLRTIEGEDGEKRYRVSLDYPEIQPFMANAESGQLRKVLYVKDQCKGGEGNVARLEAAIRLRNDIATTLGYNSWAAYQVETRMAKTRETVDAFLLDLRDKVAAKAALDLEALKAAAISHGEPGGVNIWDMRFFHNQLMKMRYAVDDFEVAQYFPLARCIEGLFAVTEELLGVRYEPIADAPRWHDDVQVFDLYDRDGTEPLARFHMDLFPRPNKYGHAAAFTLRRGRRLADGTYQKPVSAIVANFTKPTPTQPSLLRHSEVVTFFHEFGHILHQTLTTAERARFSGTATERDFVEAPSQMLEHWCWEPSVLNRFARHHETGEPLPPSLLESMVAAKNLSSGLFTQRQLFFASLDFAYHSPGFSGDTTAELQRLHGITSFPYTPGTHFQSGFGHLFGYDAGYYGYLWSHVFGDDMFTRFEAAGPLDASTGADYRAKVLERGGAVDGGDMVREFLGREPNNEAFLRGLGLKS